MNGFERFHPIVSALYFSSVIFIVVFSSNPFFSVFALAGAFFLYISQNFSARVFKELGLSLVLFLLTAVSNPLFSHKGATVLFFVNNLPITFESTLCGIANATMLLAVIYWFKCVNLVLTFDKILYLLKSFAPKIALVVSSSMRFIPLFKSKGEEIKTAQITMGLYSSDTWTDKLSGSMSVCSALITQSLENAIDTGNSMKARGYGLKPRTSYSHYKFKFCDAAMLALVISVDVFLFYSLYMGYLEFEFFPHIVYSLENKCSAFAIALFALLCLMPLFIKIKEELAWIYCKSKI